MLKSVVVDEVCLANVEESELRAGSRDYPDAFVRNLASRDPELLKSWSILPQQLHGSVVNVRALFQVDKLQDRKRGNGLFEIIVVQGLSDGGREIRDVEGPSVTLGTDAPSVTDQGDNVMVLVVQEAEDVIDDLLGKQFPQCLGLLGLLLLQRTPESLLLLADDEFSRADRTTSGSRTERRQKHRRRTANRHLCLCVELVLTCCVQVSKETL